MYLPRAALLSASIETLPDGLPHTLNTIGKMRAMVDHYQNDLTIRTTATSLLALVPEKNDYAEAQTLFEFVRDRVRYTADPVGTELLTTPPTLLQTMAGDCDDKATLLATLLESIGIPTKFVIAGYHEPGAFEHVYLVAFMRDGAIIALDPSEPCSFGWEPPMPVTYAMEN